MDPRAPNENERKKIEAIYRKQGLLKRYATYALYFALLLIVIKRFLTQYPIVDSAISILIIAVLLAIFYLVIKSELIKKKMTDMFNGGKY